MPLTPRSFFCAHLAALLLLVSPHIAMADAEVGHIPFRHYTADDGLANQNLYMGVQDGDGFTWVGGTTGLARYDGLHFRRFGLEDGLPSTLITDLSVAPGGMLWGATSRGAFYVAHGQVVPFGEHVLPENGTYSIAFDPTGRFWLTTSSGPFVRMSADRLELAAGWPGGEAFGIHFDPDGSLLVGHGSHLLRRANEASAFVDVGIDFGGTLTALVRDGHGTLWLRAGAHLWRQRAGVFEDRTVDYLGTAPGPYPRHLGLDADKRLVIPSTQGLLAVDDAGARFVPLELPPDATSLRDVWTDREGALWLAGSGLHREIGRGLWRAVRTAEGLPSNAVWGVIRTSDGRLAVATETGAAIEKGGRFERIPGIEMAGYLVEGPPGTLWFSGDGVITRYDLTTGSRRVFGAESGLPAIAVISLSIDPHDNLWAAVDSGGVYRAPVASLLGSAPARLERVVLPESSPNEMVTKLFVDDKDLWLATSHGLYVHDGGSFQRFTRADGLRADAPNLITRHDHGLCAGYATRSEITCFTRQGDRLADLHELLVPGHLTPELLGQDAKHRLWVGTARGVTILDGDKVDQFTRSDGAPGDDVSFDTFLAEADGTVWIGSSSGLGRFDGASYQGPPPPPEVAVVSAELAGHALTPGGPDAPYLSKLFVRFAALSNIDERHLEVEVQLAGYDDAWHVTENREAEYQKLPGGHYRLLVRARRPNGPWGAVTSFPFVVRVAFWQRLSFRIGAGLLALALVAWITRARARSLERKNAHLESVVQLRTAELKEKNVAARRILDAVDEALFSVTPEGRVEAEISASAQRWFGAPPKDVLVWEWLPNGDPNANRWLAMGWDTLREGVMPAEVVFDQLPRRFVGHGRTYAFSWLPNDTSGGALVVATDITDSLEAERIERARHDLMDSLRKLHEDRSGYVEFLEEGERQLAALRVGALDAATETRLVHTLKGNSASFSLRSFSELCHDLETRLHERAIPLTPAERASLSESWKAATRHLLPFVDHTSDDLVRVTQTELDAVLGALEDGASPEAIEAMLRRWRLEPTRPRLERVAQQARRLAESLDKSAIHIAIHDHGMRLPRDRWRPFWASLVHVIRNAVDHGLESERERRAAGKAVIGSLTLETRFDDGELVVAVSDDGGGIAWDKVARAAAAKGLASSTHEELVHALFADGLSTADTVTTVSGRGVGMAAVREATVSLGGRIVVRSSPGRGTTIEMRFLHDAPPHSTRRVAAA